MAERQPPISETEMDVLKVLWEHGPATVRQVNTLLRRRRRRYAYTTVLTLLHAWRPKGMSPAIRAPSLTCFPRRYRVRGCCVADWASCRMNCATAPRHR